MEDEHGHRSFDTDAGQYVDAADVMTDAGMSTGAPCAETVVLSGDASLISIPSICDYSWHDPSDPPYKLKVNIVVNPEPYSVH